MESASTSQVLHDLISGNHILHYHKVVDAYGHISVRNPANPKTFFLSKNLAPALVSSKEDLVEYHIEDASPVDPDAAKGYSERFIHSELLKRYPAVNSVVHSHSEAILPYTISDVPMLPTFHMAGFLGTQVPIYDIAQHYQRGDTRDMLVSSAHLGAALASEFSKRGSYTHIIGAAGAALVSQLTKSEAVPDDLQPDHHVVLMRGHGFTAIGTSVKEAVFRAVYTLQNAGVQTTSLLIRNAHLAAQERGRDREKEKTPVDKGLHYLSGSETVGALEMHARTSDRPWGLWIKEVEACALYTHRA